MYRMMDEDLTLMTDEALLLLSQSSEEALETLIRRHFRLVKGCARSLFLAGAEESDLIQEGLIGLLGAIRSYDPEKEAGFPAYASLCIRRHMITAVRRANASKNAPLNDALPLLEHAEERADSDPEDVYLGKERMQTLLEQLSGFEQQVLQLYLEGYSGSEIALTLHRPTKSVDNAIQRIRSKAARTFPRRSRR